MDPTIEYLTPLVFSFVALLLAFLWYYKYVIAPYSGFPSVSCLFLCGNPFHTWKNTKHTQVTDSFFQKIIQACKKFESEGLFVTWILQPYLFIYSEEAIKVFSNEPSALNKSSSYNFLRDVMGTGLLTSNGNAWKKKRKMLNPVFQAAALKEKVPIFNENAAKLVKTLMNVEDKSSLEIFNFLRICSFRNLYESVFGLKTDDPMRITEMETLIHLVNKGVESMSYRLILPWLHSKHVLRLFSWGRTHLRETEEFLKITKKILLDIKESVLSRKSKGQIEETETKFFSAQRKSFAEILVDRNLEDPSFTLNDMVYDLNTFIINGYDSVSYAMMWSVFLMGHHPEVQDLVYEEVKNLTDIISYGELLELKYLECVILESLRIFPVAPLYSRLLEKNVQCGKYNVPKGTNIVFVSYMYHRNPKIYPDPEKFDPERFLPGNPEKRSSSYIAFSEGMRNCIGKKFSLMEMKVILAHIVRHFKFTSLDPKEKIELRWKFSLTTVKPLRMHFTPRHKIGTNAQY